MAIPNDEWLEQLNRKFIAEGVSHRQRPLQAIAEWGTASRQSISITGPIGHHIFEWFKKNAPPDSQKIGSKFVGVFYYDVACWRVTIPIFFGQVSFVAPQCLKESLLEMPEAIWTRLAADRSALEQLRFLWMDCFDYGHGIGELISVENPRGFGQGVLTSGHQHLEAAVAQLLGGRLPGYSLPKALEDSTWATEKLLKGFAAMKGALTEKEAHKIKHNLPKALAACLKADPTSDLKVVEPELRIFLSRNDTYVGTNERQEVLWRAYRAAQFIGATIVRSLTKWDMRKKMRPQGS